MRLVAKAAPYMIVQELTQVVLECVFGRQVDLEQFIERRLGERALALRRLIDVAQSFDRSDR